MNSISEKEKRIRSSLEENESISLSSYDDDQDEEYSNSAHKIDTDIYKNCKRSKLKIVYMHSNDLKKLRKSSSIYSNNYLNQSQIEYDHKYIND
jgi:predicted methyltransferase